MYIQLSELKANPAKYFDLAKTTEVIVTRHGQRIGRIVSEEESARAEKKKAVEALLGTAKLPAEYGDPLHDPDYDGLRAAAYAQRNSL
jgi:prevent-host-death family protein